MAEAAAATPADEVIPPRYYDVPLQALQTSTRHRLSLHLNLRVDIIGNDWRMLAERIGLDTLEIMNLEQQNTNKTEVVLIHAMRRNYSIGKFLQILREMNRDDILYGDTLEMIDDNVRRWRPIQVAEVSSDSRAPLTFGELNEGKIEYFDAFITYHTDDYEFLTVLISKLEDEFGFKLCIPDRDCCIGIIENQATAELIKKRCKRTIVVLSTSFLNMKDLKAKLKWQLQVAQAIAPVADTMHKLIPVVIDPAIRIPEDVPEILLPYNVCDYTRVPIREWFWKRMEGSLAAHTNNDGGYKGPSGRLGQRVLPRESFRARTQTAPASLDNLSPSIECRSHRSSSETTSLTGSISSISSEHSLSQFYLPMPDTPTDSPKAKKKTLFPRSAN